MMNSKDKGNIGEAVFMAEMIKQGCIVSKPFGDNARYDFIVDVEGKLLKFQVKYCNSTNENQGIVCPCASSTNHTTNKHYSTYENDVDYMAFYIAPYDKIAIVSLKEIGNKKSIVLRNEKPLNGQTEGIRYIDDYSISHFLCVETLHDKPKEEFQG